MSVSDDIGRLLRRDIEGLERELALFPDEPTIWMTLPGVPNAAGNLVLHVAGNLQHFVGAVLGQSGYVRDRDREFSARGIPRAALQAQLDAAAAAVQDVVPALEGDWYAAPYPGQTIPGRTIPTGRFLLHLSVHAGFHLGQVSYLRRALTGDPQSANAVSLAAIVD